FREDRSKFGAAEFREDRSKFGAAEFREDQPHERRLQELMDSIEVLRLFPHVRHLSGSPWISAELRRLGLPFENCGTEAKSDSGSHGSLRQVFLDHEPGSVVVKGDKVFLDPKSSPALSRQVRARFPDLEFADVPNGCFVGLRLTDFDGNSSNVLELGFRGIKCVHNNHWLPNCLGYRGIRDIVNHISQERAHIGTSDERTAEELRRRFSVDGGQSAQLDQMDTEFFLGRVPFLIRPVLQ
ncbi:MAG: hypothetical protein ACYCOU_16415, partial [Sulfobacillus sp.]